MDSWEDLTELGYHLADLPVEPHLGKMVLCAVVLKCLDPILTIACTLAYRDPFVLPMQPSQKRASMLCRKRFAAGTFSDHMALLRAFQVSFSNLFCDTFILELQSGVQNLLMMPALKYADNIYLFILLSCIQSLNFRSFLTHGQY